MDFAAVAELCAPGVALDTLKSIASVESSFNPYAIGVVGGRLERQPRNLPEALATARMLDAQGYDYSLGVVQVNQKNFAKYGLTPETAFDPCANLHAGSLILKDCYDRAGAGGQRLGDALSCYYSGNFTTGYRLGYVAKVQSAGGTPDLGALPVQAIPVIASRTTMKVRATAKIRPSASEPLFVTAGPPAGKPMAASDDTLSPTRSTDTALLF